jgi:ABC transporter ATM
LSFLAIQSSAALSRRGFRDLAPKPGTVQPPSATKNHPVAKELDSSNNVTPKEQRKNDWNVVTKLMVNVWPKNDWKTRGTVLLGFGLLVSGKVGKR